MLVIAATAVLAAMLALAVALVPAAVPVLAAMLVMELDIVSMRVFPLG